MPLLEILLAGIGLASSATDIRSFIKEKIDERVQPETVLTELVEEGFRAQMPRLQHLCPDSIPLFHKEQFAQKLSVGDLSITNPGDLLPALLPILNECISTPGATCGEENFFGISEPVESNRD